MGIGPTRDTRLAICSGQCVASLPINDLLNGILQANKNVFPFDSTFWAQLQNISDTCGYTDYLDKFVTYPPAGQLPLPAGATFDNVTRAVGVLPECRMHSPIQRAVGV